MDIPDAAASSFVHNTIAINGKNGFTQYGVRCVSASIPLINSIVWGSTGAEVKDCGPLTGSHIEDDTSNQSCGSASDPSFTADYHLGGASQCIDAVDCVTGVTTDLDGELRPLRDSKCDVGADEVP